MSPLMRRPISLTAAFAALAFAASACSDDSSDNGGGGGGGTTSDFVGVVTSDDGLENGSLSVTVATANPSSPSLTGVALASVNATGTLSLVGGAPVSLTGTYDDATGALDVSGGGYSFTGGFDGTNRLEGTYTGPTTTGVFITALGASGTAFCGTFDGDDQGLWSFVVDGGTLLGQAVSTLGNGGIPLDGIVTGNAVTIYFPGTVMTLATGTINGADASGTWDDPNSSDAGTWTSGNCQ